MRATGLLLSIGCLTLLVACEEATATSAAPPLTPLAPPLDRRLLRGLDARAPYELRQTAQRIAASTDPALRRAASHVLVQQAMWATSPGFRDESRAQFAATMTDRPTDEMEAAIDADRDATLAEVLAAMELVGGPEATQYCLALAENESVHWRLRRAALNVLARHLDPNDAPSRQRAAASWDRVAALAAAAPGKRSGSVTNAAEVVAGMAAGFRRCYDRGLAEDPNMRGSVRLTAHIAADGSVTSVSPSGSGLSSLVVACAAALVKNATFAPPEGGGATIVIPVTFVTK